MFAAKVRRLYDIANVLRSLKLIEKFHVTEAGGRKPAFKWIGPVEHPPVQGIDPNLSCFHAQGRFENAEITNRYFQGLESTESRVIIYFVFKLLI